VLSFKNGTCLQYIESASDRYEVLAKFEGQLDNFPLSLSKEEKCYQLAMVQCKTYLGFPDMTSNAIPNDVREELKGCNEIDSLYVLKDKGINKFQKMRNDIDRTHVSLDKVADSRFIFVNPKMPLVSYPKKIKLNLANLGDDDSFFKLHILAGLKAGQPEVAKAFHFIESIPILWQKIMSEDRSGLKQTLTNLLLVQFFNDPKLPAEVPARVPVVGSLAGSKESSGTIIYQLLKKFINDEWISLQMPNRISVDELREEFQKISLVKVPQLIEVRGVTKDAMPLSRVQDEARIIFVHGLEYELRAVLFKDSLVSWDVDKDSLNVLDFDKIPENEPLNAMFTLRDSKTFTMRISFDNLADAIRTQQLEYKDGKIIEEPFKFVETGLSEKIKFTCFPSLPARFIKHPTKQEVYRIFSPKPVVPLKMDGSDVKLQNYLLALYSLPSVRQVPYL